MFTVRKRVGLVDPWPEVVGVSPDGYVYNEKVALRAKKRTHLKVTFNCSRNLFMPERRDWGVLAVVSTLGLPSNTITLSKWFV